MKSKFAVLILAPVVFIAGFLMGYQRNPAEKEGNYKGNKISYGCCDYFNDGFMVC